MASKKYLEARDNLIKAIDLANQVLLEYPLGRDKMNYVYDGVSYTLIEWFIKCNNHTKELVLNAEKKFQTLQSLKYDIEDFLHISKKQQDLTWMSFGDVLRKRTFTMNAKTN